MLCRRALAWCTCVCVAWISVPFISIPYVYIIRVSVSASGACLSGSVCVCVRDGCAVGDLCVITGLAEGGCAMLFFVIALSTGRESGTV